jgi:hypothetical protein
MILFLAILNSIIFTPLYAVILGLQIILHVPILFLCKNKTVKLYLLNNLVGTDQACNALYGGDPDETISSRVGKDEDSNIVAKWVSKFLDLFQKNHTKLVIEADEGKNKVL